MEITYHTLDASSDENLFDTLGLPVVNPQPTIPSVMISNPDQTKNTGFIDSIENFFMGAADTVEAGVEHVYSGLKKVGNDVVSGAENVVGFGTSQIVLVIGVAAISLYFLAKSGALKSIMGR
ncbi:MAG: hypothetical protein C5B47_00245 [Verrucomicrobia bacterium]|nr:MAG: hypothetical protein C5B47_00245 [Verrucomicrobiota bacterium]